MPIFGSAGREDDRGEGARASSSRQADGTEPASAQLFPRAPSSLGPWPQAAHITHGCSSQHAPVRV